MLTCSRGYDSARSLPSVLCWAALNLLVTQEGFRSSLDLAGFVPVTWDDITEESTDYLDRALKRTSQQRPTRLSPSVIRGPEFSVMIGNVLKNLEEDRLRVVQAVLDRDA